MVSLLYEFQTNQVNRPGRNLITFLIFANLYMWLWETLDSKAQGEYYHARKKYYGEQVHFSLVSYLSILYRDVLSKIIYIRFNFIYSISALDGYQPYDAPTVNILQISFSRSLSRHLVFCL